jgi:isoquinoline 1-oxidoreductase alpha subunit
MHIIINGKKHSVPEQLGDIQLIDFIREYIGLKGTKFGCGTGGCGACTVMIDEVAVRACVINVADAVGRRVTTIEGLQAMIPGEDIHPIQQAWIEEGVPQCGYCQPGQLMSAAALLIRNPCPTDQEVSDAMRGNLCRCGTYARIRSAISRVIKEHCNGQYQG